MSKVYAHFVHEEQGLFTKKTLDAIPREGDELRFGDNGYYKVTKVVWVFDEPECPMQRVNIGLVEVTDE